ncbi:Guanine nucleotide binding protein (G-protein) domain containing protein [Aphelenchoides fujianensis]|nr:Guanine nucleotide binding protein (G-protein) domain containing protein [Aphelenchoides fujianensis]
MGLCHSEEEKQNVTISKQIDKKLKEAHSAEEKVIKLLLLGAGESGKSTFLKQMRILHSNGFTADEIHQQRAVVYSNTVHAMQQLIKAMPKYKISFATQERFEDAQLIMQVIKSGDEMEPFSPQLALALKRLWDDPAICEKTYGYRLDFHLHESAKHFLDSLDRLANPSYKPSEQDILLTRIKTTGIVEVEFQIKGVQFRVFDVGGQRSERKKWIHCFEVQITTIAAFLQTCTNRATVRVTRLSLKKKEMVDSNGRSFGAHLAIGNLQDVSAVIFISALSEYDEVLFEDESTNRMVESMRLFESICNSRWFINTSVILFLNKKDLFAEKIHHYSIKKAFPEYSGPQAYDECVAFIKKKFEALNSNPRKTVYVHQTCATDTNQVQLILDSVISMIIQANLHKSGLY